MRFRILPVNALVYHRRIDGSRTHGFLQGPLPWRDGGKTVGLVLCNIGGRPVAMTWMTIR